MVFDMSLIVRVCLHLCLATEVMSFLQIGQILDLHLVAEIKLFLDCYF